MTTTTIKTSQTNGQGSGFGGSKEKVFKKAGYINLDNAIDINEVKTRTLTLGDLEEGEYIPLDYGVTFEKDGQYEQLHDYKFKEEFTNPGKRLENLEKVSKWESKYLRQADKSAGGDFAKHCPKISSLLASCIESVGGYPLDQLLEGVVGLKSRKREDINDIFGVFAYSDIANMIYTLRYQYTGTWDYYIGNRPCACQKTTITDTEKEDKRTLSTFKYKQMPSGKGFDTYPIFKVKVYPFKDAYNSVIDTLYLRPFLFYDFYKIYDQNSKKEEDIIKQLELMTVGMPQSELYGQNRPGRIFVSDLWNEYMLNETREELQAALLKLQPGNLLGIKDQFQIDCPNCPQETPVTIQPYWILASDFILASKKPRPEDL